MEAPRSEKRVEERSNRMVVTEEQEAKEEKEKAAARGTGELYAKAIEGIRKSLEGTGQPKETWEQFRDHWMELWGEGGHFGDFEDNTAMPPMRFTSCGPNSGITMDTLQFFSIKIASIDDSLQWPLDVYGFVAFRDVLDRKRNMIFCCHRDNCQTIYQQDPYLALTGPTRAVAVSGDPAYFEVKLKVKGTAESEDKDFSLFASTYSSHPTQRIFTSKLSTLDMSFQELFNSVEATISTVEIIHGSWPDGFLGEFSASTDNPPDMEVTLLKCVDDKLPVDADGKIQLTRRVVSVQLKGFLKVSIMAHCVDGKPKSRQAVFAPKRNGISFNSEIEVGSCRVKITVSWSLFGLGP